MFKKSALYTSVFLIVGILILTNMLAHDYFLRLDFTEDQRYTLSEATRSILNELEEPVTITAYFSEDLPPDIAKTKDDFQDLLVEYNNASDDQVVYEFTNPNESEEAEQAAMQAGISPVLVNVRDKDQVSQKRAYLGAVVRLGEQEERVPFIQPGAAMEYALSTAIKKLALVDKPSVGVLQGHGEAALTTLPQVSGELGVLYSVENLTLTDTTTIPTKFKTIAIVAPTDSFPTNHLQQLDEFLGRGGNLFVALDRVDGNLQTAAGSEVNTGLESWLAQKGITVSPSFVIDASSGAVTVQQQQGPFTMNTQVQFPYLPLITNFAEHPVTQGLEAVILPFASPIGYTGTDSSATATFTSLALSSDQSGTQPAPTYFDINRQWTEADFPEQNLTVAAALEGNLVGSTPAKMVVVSDGGFATQGGGGRQSDNVSLLVNGVDWLSDDTGLIELRTKGVTSRPIEQLEDSTKTTLKYLNFLLPILLVVAYGVIRSQAKRRQRVQRREERYA